MYLGFAKEFGLERVEQSVFNKSTSTVLRVKLSKDKRRPLEETSAKRFRLQLSHVRLCSGGRPTCLRLSTSCRVLRAQVGRDSIVGWISTNCLVKAALLGCMPSLGQGTGIGRLASTSYELERSAFVAGCGKMHRTLP